MRITGYRMFYKMFNGFHSLIIATMLAISVRASPTAETSLSNRLTSEPRWLIEPCGLIGKPETVFNDKKQLDRISIQARTALDFTRMFLNEEECMNVKQHTSYARYSYEWLPSKKEITKSLGEQLSQTFLDELEKRGLDAFLLDAYEYMQKYAVGFEQIIWDLEDYKLEPLEKFKGAKDEIEAVLCELHILLAERQLAPRVNVTREIMPQDVRNIKVTALRDLRDCLILRQCVNGLEFIISVFEHFQQRKLMTTPSNMTLKTLP